MESGAEGLVVIDAGCLSATLDAEARFLAAVALDLEDPHELHEVATFRQRVSTLPSPRAVGLMVLDFGVHGLGPTDWIGSERCSARAGVPPGRLSQIGPTVLGP